MRINNLEKNNNKLNFKNVGILAKPLGVFYDTNAVLPTFLIEGGVTSGRSAVAYKRGGRAEASDRLVEQGASAVVWIWGVQFLKKINEKLAQMFLNFKNKNNSKADFDFDIGFDALRNPVQNNLKNGKISKNIAVFKMINLLASTALATFFIGFILPKINNKITDSILRKEKNTKDVSMLDNLSFEKYRHSNSKKISFTSSFLSTFAHSIENNSKFRMLLTDSGVVSGRFLNGRNKYMKIEGLFRDIASIYFYLASTKHIVKLLNKITKNTDINPVTLDETVKFLSFKINSDDGILKQDFVEHLKDGLSNDDISRLDSLFKEKKAVSFEEFCEFFNDKTQLNDDFLKKAKKMTNLQPVFDEKRFLSKTQAYDVLSSSWLSNPEFLKNTMNKTTKGKSDNPLKFVSMEFLDNERKTIHDFVQRVISNAEKDNQNLITKEYIEKIARKTTTKNFIYYSFATALSTFVLAIIIPKIQYFITKKLTNQNKFPQAQEYKSPNTKAK